MTSVAPLLAASLFLFLIPFSVASPLHPSLHDVDTVGPALSNATQEAIAKGKAILTKYSDVVTIVSIPTGVAVSFFGYFLLAPVLFLASFVVGGGACFVAVNEIVGNTTPAAAWISIAAMLLGGALLGFFAMRALNIGMFFVGAALGAVLASAFKTTLIAQIYPKDPQLAFIIAAVTLGLIFGLIALYLQKQMLIFSTAYAGACACVFGIGHFAGHFPTSDDLANIEKGTVTPWILLYIGLAALIGTVGMFFQFWLARGKEMPEHAPHDRRRRRRRSRPVHIDSEWSDDDWVDDTYVERFPLPSRKREPIRVISHPPVEQPQPSVLPVQFVPVHHAWSDIKQIDKTPNNTSVAKDPEPDMVTEKPLAFAPLELERHESLISQIAEQPAAEVEEVANVERADSPDGIIRSHDESLKQFDEEDHLEHIPLDNEPDDHPGFPEKKLF